MSDRQFFRNKRLPNLRKLLSFSLLPLCQAAALAATWTVQVIDNEYQPKTVTIAPGDTVTWVNQGSEHTVTADDSKFESPILVVGQSYSFTFPDLGRFPYFCQLHGGPNGQDMAGVVRVADPSSNNPPATPTNVSPAANAQNQSVSPTLTASAFSDSDTGDEHAFSQWIITDKSTNTVALDTGEIATSKTSLALTDLANSTVYAWKVRYKDDRGAWSEYSAETQFTTVANQSTAGTGLTGTYAKYVPVKETVTTVATRVDATIDFDWKLAKAHPSAPANNFLVRWEGKLLPKYSDVYRFRVKADGGVRLWINGTMVINDWVSGPFALFRNNTIQLQAGVPADIKLEYFDTLGAASISLRWSSRQQPFEVIPQANLFPLPQ